MIEVFSKIATLTDIRDRLELPKPRRTLKHIIFPQGRYKVDLAVTDRSGRQWKFSCCKRRKGYSKPCLRSGWLVFVRSKGVRIGDRITLSRLDRGEFRIEVHRAKLRLFGQNFIEDEVA